MEGNDDEAVILLRRCCTFFERILEDVNDAHEVFARVNQSRSRIISKIKREKNRVTEEISPTKGYTTKDSTTVASKSDVMIIGEGEFTHCNQNSTSTQSPQVLGNNQTQDVANCRIETERDVNHLSKKQPNIEESKLFQITSQSNYSQKEKSSRQVNKKKIIIKGTKKSQEVRKKNECRVAITKNMEEPEPASLKPKYNSRSIEDILKVARELKMRNVTKEEIDEDIQNVKSVGKPINEPITDECKNKSEKTPSGSRVSPNTQPKLSTKIEKLNEAFRKYEMALSKFYKQVEQFHLTWKKANPSIIINEFPMEDDAHKLGVVTSALEYIGYLQQQINEHFVNNSDKGGGTLSSRLDESYITIFQEICEKFDHLARLLQCSEEDNDFINDYEREAHKTIFGNTERLQNRLNGKRKKLRIARYDVNQQTSKSIPFVSLCRWLPDQIYEGIFELLYPHSLERDPLSKKVNLFTYANAKELQQLYRLRHQIQELLFTKHINNKVEKHFLPILNSMSQQIRGYHSVDSGNEEHIYNFLRIWRMIYNLLICRATITFIPVQKNS